MINPLDELSDIYLGQISEADNSPEAIKARVMQHVRAIRYRARKEGDQLNKAYNDYMAGQAGISATEKSMVKERLGLTGGSQHQEGMAYGMYLEDQVNHQVLWQTILVKHQECRKVQWHMMDLIKHHLKQKIEL